MQLRKSRRYYRREWSTGLGTILRTEAMYFVIEGQKEEDPGILLVYEVSSNSAVCLSLIVFRRIDFSARNRVVFY